MSDIAIRVENLGKKYRLGRARGHEGTVSRYRSLREEVASLPRRLAGHYGLHGKRDCQPVEEEFWALRDVTFDVKEGAALGVIGRNGAGKSTLLKILSRITEPSAGRVRIKGRVASLLEVGTGFHPELTGRENIFLNGAILGMTRAEMKAKFDEIVEFAGVERFLDTPVKRFSSGMYVRLAFAVAAHLEPEILVIDEVLAVGDAEFQKKCLRKMDQVARGGRTVLFVSHQMGAIAQLCDQALLLTSGQLTRIGTTQAVINQYLASAGSGATSNFLQRDTTERPIFLQSANVQNIDGNPCAQFTHDESIVLALIFQIVRWVPGTVMGFFVRDMRGRRIFTENYPAWERLSSHSGQLKISATIPGHFLVPGHYTVSFAVTALPSQVIDHAEEALSFTIVDGGSMFSAWEGSDYGCVFAACSWDLNSKPTSAERAAV